MNILLGLIFGSICGLLSIFIYNAGFAKGTKRVLYTTSIKWELLTREKIREWEQMEWNYYDGVLITDGEIVRSVDMSYFKFDTEGNILPICGIKEKTKLYFMLYPSPYGMQTKQKGN